MTPPLPEDTVRLLESLGADRSELPDDPGALGALASDLVFEQGAHLRLDQVAERTALSTEAVAAVYRSLGVRIEPDRPMFTDDDIELVAILAEAVDGPLEPGEGEQLLRVAARSLATLADAGVAESVQGVEQRQASADELVRAHVALSRLGIRLGSALGAAFRHHLRQAVRRQRMAQTGVSSPELVRVTTGFVDLVGFTGLSADLPVAELVRLVDGLEQRSSTVVGDRDLRITKLIGDEVMFVGYSPHDACAFALELIDAFAEEGIVPRGGLACGEVLFRHGDHYGPVVNLASRLADIAVPGEILVDASLTGLDGVTAVPAGRRQLPGFDRPVDVYALEPSSGIDVPPGFVP